MGQAKRRGSLEDRIRQAQSRGADRYPQTLPRVVLQRLTADSPQEWIECFKDYNTDYLCNYTARGTQEAVYTREQARQLVEQECAEWIAQPSSQVHLAFNDNDEIVGYVTTHTGGAAIFHADSPESLIEDIYVASEHRHLGYMTAIRKAANTTQILVDKIRLRNLVGYYVKAGFRSFNVHYYNEHNSFAKQKNLVGLMKSNVSVRRDGKGLYGLHLKDIDLAIKQDKRLMTSAFGKTIANRYTVKEPA
jgi:hypothetical protein